MLTNEIRPYQTHPAHRDKSCDAVYIVHVGVLDVEKNRGLHRLECRFNLPLFPVCLTRALRTIEAYEDLKLLHSIGVSDPAAGKMDILAFVYEELVMELLLSHKEIIEDPRCPDFLSGGGLHDPKILSDPDIMPVSHGYEPSPPFFPAELAVRKRQSM